MSDHIPNYRIRLTAVLLLTIESIAPTYYRVGRVIKLWDYGDAGPGSKEAWTFSYHRPDGVTVIDYRLTLETYDTEEKAQAQMASFVWNMNQLNMGRM